ncbi:MAG: hypothetical protein KAJ97_00150 [Acidobacteria bacterium]|nr:hypothetical protein [Acidobacteriota bacterium]
MAYPGNPELSPQAQERVITAFRQVVTKLQEGKREEALIGLEFVLRLDPTFAPSLNLHQQLSSGAAEIDLSQIIAELQAPTTETINSLLVEAVEDFNNREFAAAKEKVEKVLLDLPGHQEGRQLLGQIQEASKVEAQVSQFLAQARQALDQSDSQEAANFVMMAQALDPHHEGIAATLAEIDQSGGMSHSQAEFMAGSAPPGGVVSFDSIDDSPPAFETEEPGDGLFADEAVGEVSAPPPPEPVASPTEAESADIGARESEHLSDESAIAPPPTFESVESEPAAAASYEATGGDVSDLFEAGPTAAPTPAEPPPGAQTPTDPEALIQDLLARGESAAAVDDYAAAIDAWSRIFLIDHAHEEAAHRVEHLRHAKEELDRRLEPMLDDARAAHFNGDEEAASSLLEQVLALDPKHVNATRLKERLDAGKSPEIEAAHEVAGSEMPDLEEDLFSDEIAPSQEGEVEAAVAGGGALEAAMPTLEPARRPALWRLIGLAAGGLLIVLVGLWAGSRLLSSPEPEDQAMAVNQLLREADALFQQNKVAEAVHLLEQFPADDIYKQRIDLRLAKYHQAMAPPTPTPVPKSLITAEELLEEGLWMAAYQQVMGGLARHPMDTGLEDLRRVILEIEEDVAPLHRAILSANHSAVASIAKDLLELHPGQADVAKIYERSLFNASMAELRAYNLTAAESYLNLLLVRQPDDQEVQRVLDFIASYKVRPVDMQLEIFIRSIAER